MSKTKTEVAELLKASAERLRMPLDFEEDENGVLFSAKHVLLEGIDEDNDFMHGVGIDDESLQSMCSIRLEKKLDRKVLAKLCSALEEKMEFPFCFDTRTQVISTGVDIWIDSLDTIPQDEAEADEFLMPFFAEPLYLIRDLYTAYIAVTENGRTIKEALRELDEEAEEANLGYEYRYNIVRDIVEERGNRYYFEHRHFPLAFYSCPDDLIALLQESDDKDISEIFEGFLSDYDVPPVDGYERLHAEKWEDSPQRKCVHIVLPACREECDCSDIVLVVSEKETYYYTVEAGAASPGTAKRDYFLCGWGADACHSNFGSFNCRDRALAALRKRLKENE